MALSEQTVGSHDEVFLRRTLNVSALNAERDLLSRRNFQLIVDTHRIEYGLQVMVAISTASHHVETEVYLCTRPYFHNRYLINSQSLSD